MSRDARAAAGYTPAVRPRTHDACSITALPGFEIPGQTQSRRVAGAIPEANHLGPKLIIVMVGLPARGKSYISRKLARYLNWLQYETKVFNAGQTRRSSSGPAGSDHSAKFFDPDNEHAVQQREAITLQTLSDLLSWLRRSRAVVGILDATNSTVQRRQAVINCIQQTTGPSVEVLFLESCCYDHIILEKNILLKLSGPDYRNNNRDASLRDFRKRVQLYEKNYTPIGSNDTERHVPYVRLVDVGRQVIANCISGFMSSQVVEYLLNFRLHERQIWITRNGESLDDEKGVIGRTSPLSLRGLRFASALSKFTCTRRAAWDADRCRETRRESDFGDLEQVPSSNLESCKKPPAFHVWTSMMKQTIETCQGFDEGEYKIKHLRMLNDLHAGHMAGHTFDEISSKYPEEMAMRQSQPVYYRWPGPGGESYADLIHRLRPIINELERMEDHVLLITHRAVARVLLAYFQDLKWDDITNIDIPLGHVFSVEVRPYGVAVESYQYDDQTATLKSINQ